MAGLMMQERAGHAIVSRCLWEGHSSSPQKVREGARPNANLRLSRGFATIDPMLKKTGRKGGGP